MLVDALYGASFELIRKLGYLILVWIWWHFHFNIIVALLEMKFVAIISFPFALSLFVLYLAHHDATLKSSLKFAQLVLHVVLRLCHGRRAAVDTALHAVHA